MKLFIENKVYRFATQFVCAIALFSSVALAYDGKPAPATADEKPQGLQEVGIDEKLGQALDPNITLTNNKGEVVQLSQFFNKSKKPIMLSLVYFACPGLCNFHLNDVTSVMKNLDWKLGDKYQYLTVSFDPKETAEMAEKKRQNYLKQYGQDDPNNDWTFLVGDEANVKKITESVGFKYKWDEASQEWAHASAVILLTPDGRISRYLPGLALEEKNLKIGLNEAADGSIGTFVDKLILYCFKYDPHQSKYTLYAFNLVKLGGLITVLLLGVFLILAWRRESKKSTSSGEEL